MNVDPNRTGAAQRRARGGRSVDGRGTRIALLAPLLASLLALSPSHSVEPAAQDNAKADVVIDDFSGRSPDDFPDDWKFFSGLKTKDAKDARKNNLPYLVREQGDNRFLEAIERDGATTLVYEHKWKLADYPCVQWRWRVEKFPEGANERLDNHKDTAASVYVIFKVKRFLGIAKGIDAIRYLWSNVLEVGDTMTRRGSEHLFVLETGTETTGEWRTETVNVYDSYRKLFGKKPPKEAVSIGLRTDSDSTGTVAIAHYDDIKLLAQCADDRWR